MPSAWGLGCNPSYKRCKKIVDELWSNSAKRIFVTISRRLEATSLRSCARPSVCAYTPNAVSREAGASGLLPSELRSSAHVSRKFACDEVVRLTDERDAPAAKRSGRVSEANCVAAARYNAEPVTSSKLRRSWVFDNRLNRQRLANMPTRARAL